MVGPYRVWQAAGKLPVDFRFLTIFETGSYQVNSMIQKLSPWICALVVAVGAATTVAANEEAAKKAQILASDRWKKVVQEFDQWLSLQVVYTPEQAAQLRAKLAAEVQKMSAEELEQFLNQWDAKLKVLLGKDAAEAREWLAQNLQVMADGYRKKFLQQLGITDITTMTAAQIEDAMERMRAQRMALIDQRQMFDQSRQQQLKIAQQFEDASAASKREAGQGEAGQFGTFQSQYAPRQYNYRPPPPVFPLFWW